MLPPPPLWSGQQSVPPFKGDKLLQRFEISPDGKYIAFFGNHELILFDTDTVSLVEKLTVPCKVNGIAFHPEAPLIYTIGGKGSFSSRSRSTWPSASARGGRFPVGTLDLRGCQYSTLPLTSSPLLVFC